MNTPLEKIDRPGVYALSDDVYHGACTVGPGVSASTLKTFLDKGPDVCWAQSPHNPDYRPKPPTDAMIFGSIYHLRVLEPARFSELVVIDEHEGSQKKEAKEWRTEMAEAGLYVIKEAAADVIEAMCAALMTLPEARAVLQAGKREPACVWQDEETGIWVKSKPDHLPISSGRFIGDLKTAMDLAVWEDKALIDWRYDIQAFLQIEGARRCAGIEPLGVAYLVQEKEQPYRAMTRLIELDSDIGQDILKRAEAATRAALTGFAQAWETGDWTSSIARVGRLGDNLKPWSKKIVGADLGRSDL